MGEADSKGLVRVQIADERPAELNSNIDNNLTPQSELEAHSSQPPPASSSPLQVDISSHTTRAQDILTETQPGKTVHSGEEEEKKLRILRERMERIREEKERLERLQHLKELEEQTKQEIMEAQRRGDNGE